MNTSGKAEPLGICSRAASNSASTLGSARSAARQTVSSGVDSLMAPIRIWPRQARAASAVALVLLEQLASCFADRFSLGLDPPRFFQTDWEGQGVVGRVLGTVEPDLNLGFGLPRRQQRFHKPRAALPGYAEKISPPGRNPAPDLDTVNRRNDLR